MRESIADRGTARSRVYADAISQDLRVMSKLATCSTERVGDCEVDVLVRVIMVGTVRHRDHAVRDDELDPDMEDLAVATVAVRQVDDGVAALDPAERERRPRDPAFD